MAFIPLPGGVKLEVKFLKNGQLVVNIYHFRVTGAITTIDLTAIAELVKNAWNDNIKTVTVDDMTLESLIATDVSMDEGIQITYTTGLPLAGLSTADDLPSNVAVVISNKTEYTGRSNRGRTYMCGMPATTIIGNTVGSGLQTAYAAYHAQIADDALALGYDFGVASYQEDNAPRVTGAFQTYTAFTVDNITDSQRRRLPGRGA